MALRPTQPPIQRVKGSLSLGVKRPGREADHSPSSSAEVKVCVELYLHSQTRLHCMVLSLQKKNHRNYFTFTLPLSKQGHKISHYTALFFGLYHRMAMSRLFILPLI
jgi:hypothetical protein